MVFKIRIKFYSGLLIFLVTILLSDVKVFADQFIYSQWELILNKCVIDGVVDQRALKDNEHLLYSFYSTIASVSYSEYKKWSTKEKQAFWINAYNAFSLLLVLKNYFTENFADAYYGPQNKLFNVFEKQISLNEVKHSFLRGIFFDERIHFALSSPANGFPLLRQEAYLAMHLNLLLEDDVIRFIRDYKNVLIDREKKKVYLSEVFKWFGKDFVRRYGNDNGDLKHFNIRQRAVVNFLASYLFDYREFLLSGKYEIEYYSFDWKVRKVITE